MENKVSKLDKIITLCIVISPILYIYRAFKYFMLGEIVFAILFILFIIKNRNKQIKVNDDNKLLVIYICLIAFFSMIGFLLSDSKGIELIIRLLRYMINVLFIITLGCCSFNKEYGFKYLIRFCFIALILLVFQFVYTKITGKFIYFNLKKHIYSSSYDDNYYNVLEKGNNYRPQSLFLEPNHYCKYFLFALGVVLISNLPNKKKYIYALLFTGSMFLTSSSAGVVLIPFVWFFYLIYCLKEKNVNLSTFNKVLFILIILGIIGFIVFKKPILFALNRILGSKSSAVSLRLGTYKVFTDTSNLIGFLFGNGFGNVDVSAFYASYPYLFASLGLFGFIIIIISLLLYYRKLGNNGRFLFLIFLMLGLATDVLISFWCIMQMTFVIKYNREGVIHE